MPPSAAEARHAEKSLEKARRQASISLNTLLSTIQTLCDVDFYAFRKQLEIAAFANQRHPCHLNLAVEVPDEDDNKFLFDQSVFYQVLMAKSRGSPAAYSLDQIPIGDGRAVWGAIQRYYLRNTTSGRAAATKKFHTATMASTNTNVTRVWGSDFPIRPGSD